MHGLKFGYILAGLLVLANPNIGIIDILPDFIGFLLIIKGLSTSVVFIPALNSAEKKLWKMFIVSVIKVLMSFILLKDIHTMPLLLAFSFAVIELIILLPALNDLFEGIFYVAMRFSGRSAIHSKTKSKIVRDPVTGRRELKEVEIDRGGKVKRAALIFIIYRTVLSILPTLTDLQLSDNTGEVEAVEVVRYFDFSNVISLLTFAVCLIGTVVWMCFLIPYFHKIIKDRELHEGISKAYQSELDLEPKIPVGIQFKKIIILIGGTVVFYNSIMLDGVNYFPKAISALFAIGAAVSLLKYAKKALLLIIPATIVAVVSVPHFIAQIQYFRISEYVTDDSFWITTAGALYKPLKAYSLIENSLMLPVLLILIISLYNCWKRDCNDDDLLFTPDRFTLESRESIKKRFVFTIISTVLVCVLWALYPILVLYFRFFATIAIILTFVWTLFVLYFLSDIYSQYKKYITKE